jgi:hypothetical protein
MAHHCTWTARQGGRQLTTLRRYRGVPYRVDTPVFRVKAPYCHAVLDRAAPEAERGELRE